MNSWVRLAPAYPPEIGEPERAAPLEIRMIDAPARKGRDSAALQKLNAILTSASQLIANSCQLSSCSGTAGGNAPAHTTRTSGSRASNTCHDAASSRASSDRISTAPVSAASSRSGPPCRATASTCAPLPLAAATILRPTPRLPPMTTTFLPVSRNMSLLPWSHSFCETIRGRIASFPARRNAFQFHVSRCSSSLIPSLPGPLILCVVLAEGGFSNVGYLDPLRMGPGFRGIVVVPVPPLVRRRL